MYDIKRYLCCVEGIEASAVEEDETVKYNDFRIPYSYYRIEVDPIKTAHRNGYQLEDIGVNNDCDFFVCNANFLPR